MRAVKFVGCRGAFLLWGASFRNLTGTPGCEQPGELGIIVGTGPFCRCFQEDLMGSPPQD